MNRTLGLLLAGGVGSRLGVLASRRAKPAVPFGGIYRIIDFTLSNAANSGINHLGILTQYKPLSLMQHIGNGEAWGYVGRSRGAKILPPRTGEKDSDWYRGTADAVRQNMDFIANNDYADTLLILSGDHIYQMDYSKMIAYHYARKADMTIATMQVPREEAHRFGIAVTDNEQRIIGWQEKPAEPESNQASMGIYVFSKEFLLSLCYEHLGDDFGKHIVPFVVQHARAFAYEFCGYWRDVGTVKAYWQANLDLLGAARHIDPESWRIYTNFNESNRIGDRPPTYIAKSAEIKSSIVSQGCIIEGSVINSVLSPGVWVQKGATVKNSVIMNGCEIGIAAQVENAILDKHVVIRDGACIGDQSHSPQIASGNGVKQNGITVVGKYASLPNDCRVGMNCVIFPGVKAEDFPSTRIDHNEIVMRPEDATLWD